MKIVDFLDATRIIPELNGRDKKAVLEEMAESAASQSQSLNSKTLVEVLLAREKIGSTAVGEGVAIPHGKLPGIKKTVAVFARSAQGVDFESQDGSLSHLFFLLVAPEDSTTDHLKALARVSRLLRDTAVRERLMGGKTREDILDAIEEEDEKL